VVTPGTVVTPGHVVTPGTVVGLRPAVTVA
jgi:hypothetical protein